MLIYYIVIVSVLLLGAAAQKQDLWTFQPRPGDTPAFPVQHTAQARNTFILLALIPILVAGLRYRVGTDYGAYYFYWEEIYANSFWTSLWRLDEPGYRLIAKITQSIGCKTGALAIFLASVVTIGLGYWTIYRNATHLFLPSILFLSLGNWVASFNGVRQCLAAAVIFLGYPYLRDKKLWKYAIVVFCAFLCHKSAILMIVPFFFLHCECNIRNVLLVLIGSIVLLNSYQFLFRMAGEVLEKEYDFDNMNAYNLAAVNRLRVLANILPAGIFSFLHFRQSNRPPLANFWVNLLILNASISLCAMNSPYLTRFNLYTHPLMVLALPELVSAQTKELRVPLAAGMVFLYLTMSLYELHKSSVLNHFQWIWNA